MVEPINYIPMKRIFIVLLIIAVFNNAEAQSVKLLTSGKKVSFRGLSVVNDKTLWVSGTGGTVGLSTDAGDSWKWITVKGYEKTDFRDIEAFDNTTAIIMGIDTPAVILKTTDGGETWNKVFEDKRPGMFLDAMDFWDDKRGVVIGDPINGIIFLAQTYDGGENWRQMPDINSFAADSGEACFASSGTNIRKVNHISNIYITGGKASHLFVHNQKMDLPIKQGTESTGANSVALKNGKEFIVVGGDFNAKDATDKNCVITIDAGKTWTSPQEPPHGYRSCVEYLEKDKWITCGLNGVDISKDGGKTWNWISKDGYHVCRMAKKGSAVFFAGGGGRIGRLEN